MPETDATSDVKGDKANLYLPGTKFAKSDNSNQSEAGQDSGSVTGDKCKPQSNGALDKPAAAVRQLQPL